MIPIALKLKFIKLNKVVNKFSLLSLVFLFFTLSGVSGQMKEELYEQRKKLQQEIDYAEKLLISTSKKKDQRLNTINILKAKINNRERLIDNFIMEIRVIDNQIQDRNHSILKLNEELARQKKLYADFIRYSYKNHNHFSTAIYLLASDNFNQFYLRKKYLEQLRDARVSKITLIANIEIRIASEIRVLEHDRLAKEKSLSKLRDEKVRLANEKRRNENNIKVLSGEETELRKKLREKKKIEEEIKRRIEALIREEAKKSKFAKLTPEQQLISDDFVKNKGRLPWPTRQGVITEKFGEHWHPVIKGIKTQNNGIDITTLQGENVRAVFSGEVTKIFRIPGAKYTVIIKHGSYYSVYHNLNNVSVNVGDKIATKNQIGSVSNINNGDDLILHFEIWRGSEMLNPEDWISN